LAIFILAHVQLNAYRVLKENKPNDLGSPRGHLLVYASVVKTLCGGKNSLRHFPYNCVTDESPPAGAAKHRVPGYNDN